MKEKEKFTVIKIREKDYKKLESYKVHHSQPYWEIVKDILDGKFGKICLKKEKN